MIGERLLDLRKEAKLTQNELGAILKVNKHSISSYERDQSEPPDEIKIRIARYFGVSIDYLLGMTDNPVPDYQQANVVRLPADFSRQAMEELENFIRYLKQKNAK